MVKYETSEWDVGEAKEGVRWREKSRFLPWTLHIKVIVNELSIISI